MPSNFPNGLDSFTDPAADSPLTNPRHHAQHGDVNDAVEAIQIKVGINDSADADSFDYRIRALEEGGGGGGGSGPSARAMYFVTPGAGTASTPLPLTFFEGSANAATYVGVDGGTGKLSLQPGIYTVDLLLVLKIGVTNPPVFTMEASPSGTTQVFPGGFCAINDAGGAFNGARTATLYMPSAGLINLIYNGSHADISTGLVTVIRQRDI